MKVALSVRLNRDRRRALLVAMFAFSFGATSCGSERGGVKGLNCFPEPARRWISVSASANKPVDGKMAKSATIYVDRSASMAGYLLGATQFERPFQDLVRSVPDTLREIGVSAEYRGFGTTIGEPVAPGDHAFERPAYFVCARRGGAGCESHLDQVFARIADDSGKMAVVVTDLWFDNSAENTSSLTALQPLLARILEGGRAVALYGLDAPFKGKIYDLPTSASATDAISYEGRHPLFMMVIGSKAQILDFGTQLTRSGSPFISKGLASGSIKRSIFTVDPGPEHPRDKTPLEFGTSRQLRPQTFETFGPASIQQFMLADAGLPKPGVSAGGSPSWTGPKPDAFVEDAVWEGPTAPSVSIWRRKDEKCTKDSWIPLGSMEGGWQDEAPGQRRFSLDPGRFFARVGRNGVYVLTGELRRSSVDSPNAANRWMQDWNLTPERAAAAAAAPPALFPTLNLLEVARHMENALATAAERKGGGITGFSVMVKVER